MSGTSCFPRFSVVRQPVRRPLPEHRLVDTGDQPGQRVLAAENAPRLIVTAQGGEGMGVEIVIPEPLHVHGVGPDAAADQSGPAGLLGIELRFPSPRLEPDSDLGGAGLVLGGTHDPPVLVQGQPFPAGGVDMVVDIQREQRTRRLARTMNVRLAGHETARNVAVAVAVEIRHADEIEDGEIGLPDMRRLAGAAPAHLPVEDRAFGEARHHQIDDFRAVETGVEHVHADQDLRKFLVLEPLDDRTGIRGRPAADVADDEIGVAHRGVRLEIGKVGIEHLCQRFRMAARHGEHDGLAPSRQAADLVPASKAPLQHVAEFAHEGAVALRDREFALQRARIDRDGVGLCEQFLELRPRV